MPRKKKSNFTRKKEVPKKVSEKVKESNDEHSGFESFEEDMESQDIEEFDPQDFHTKPDELFFENDVDGKQICPILDYTSKKPNGMLEAARTKFRDPQQLIEKCKKIPKVKITRIKEVPEKPGRKARNNDFNKENEKVGKDGPEKTRVVTSLRIRGRTVDYHINTDDYFAIQSEKAITSNNTLSKLNKQLDGKTLQELLKDSKHISKDHQETIETNYLSLQCRYEEWLQIMEEGFNVLLYGLGSKRSLINDFYKKMISDEPTLIINGFFPSLTIKEILDNIITEVLGLSITSSQSECLNIIKSTMNSHPDERMYLLIHNIDGDMLRSQRAQEILSSLSSISNVHVLASIDHINAPLIWDNVMRAKFNFYWVDATTFLPYQAETSYEGSLLLQKSGNLALLSMKNVFASLTKNAKDIFIILVKYQLENSGHNYSGMTFKDLLTASRERFLVSSDGALRAQLIEFTDHKLVKQKRNVDGAESLTIPLDNSLLKQFLEQYNEK